MNTFREAHAQLSKVSGLQRAYASFIFETNFKYRDNEEFTSDTSAFKFFKPMPNVTNDYYLHEALDLCEKKITSENFGLTLKDFLEMDLSTFQEIKKRIESLEEIRRIEIEKLKRDQEKDKKNN